MTNSISIVDILVGILNVEQLTNLITGSLSRGKRTERPDNTEYSDIVIVPLPNYRDDFIDRGVININCYAPNLSNNMPDEVKLKEIIEMIDYLFVQYDDGDHFYKFEIESDSMVTDERDETYYNIRVNYFVES